ncbi:transposase [Aneurinibacillus sp. UBA3580]|nr:transposase [Aneurinibacillus sp. UBA3580]
MATFLPPYSPDLNPIERIWKWLKEAVIFNLTIVLE